MIPHCSQVFTIVVLLINYMRVAISADLPYRGLQKFGLAFLNRFEGSQLPSEVLRNITLIDTKINLIRIILKVFAVGLLTAVI